jgi:divinyl chlorophyllide a 8-vinyl-reductase
MPISTIATIDAGDALAHTQQLRARLLGESPTRHTYAVGARGEGHGENVLVLGGTGYIGRALVPELARRGYHPVVLTRDPASATLPEFGGADVLVGDPVEPADVERVFERLPIQAVISLLSSRRPNDPEECRRVDYTAVTNGIRSAAAHGARQFIHVSDYGCYRPELLPQIYKLQVEGELIGGHHGGIDWTIVRPTAYFPYLSVNFGDVKHGRPYRIFDHGEYALSNPIAREDLSEFLVNALFDPEQYSRVLPVGGPWVADNVVSIRSAGEMMFEVLGREPQWEVEALTAWDAKTRRLRRMGKVYPAMRNVAFYLDAAKYWSVVDHIAPPYGTATLRDFFLKLRDREFPTGSFRERMKAGTAAMPTDV